MPVSRSYVIESVASALAAEVCCRPEDFAEEDELQISELTSSEAINPIRRRFPWRACSFAVTTMGAGVVVSATSNWMNWVSELFRDVEPADAFSLDLLSRAYTRAEADSYTLHEPHLYHVTSSCDLRERATPAGYAIEVGGQELLETLSFPDWPNAISLSAPAQGRPVTVVALALRNGVVVGVATATADSDTLWQIGIDVRSDHRDKGLGSDLTSRVAAAVLSHGRVPYYGTTVGNIASRRTAMSAGFYPCWVSAYTTKR